MIGLPHIRLAMGFFVTLSFRSGLRAQNDRGMAVGLQHKGHCEERSDVAISVVFCK